MMTREHAVISSSPDDTTRLATLFADALSPGDVVLLEGPVGAGKSHFARAAILRLLPAPEDIPSPTYTLVQTYATPIGDVLHADLYRIANPIEIHELGLLAAFEEDICLVEWPDRLGGDTPQKALTVTLDVQGNDDARIIRFSWTDPLWDERVKEALSDRSGVA
ncbi:MAG: tRNA (adenosine(37)-N6)-threonylcarbamoyltransferase complex ATPase subunit type 1 TsaE [Pseudomonadota bacterium]